jgi:hypothetical protein
MRVFTCLSALLQCADRDHNQASEDTASTKMKTAWARGSSSYYAASAIVTNEQGLKHGNVVQLSCAQCTRSRAQRVSYIRLTITSTRTFPISQGRSRINPVMSLWDRPGLARGAWGLSTSGVTRWWQFVFHGNSCITSAQSSSTLTEKAAHNSWEERTFDEVPAAIVSVRLSFHSYMRTLPLLVSSLLLRLSVLQIKVKEVSYERVWLQNEFPKQSPQSENCDDDHQQAGDRIQHRFNRHLWQ